MIKIIPYLICLVPAILLTTFLFFKNPALRRYKWQLLAFFLMGAVPVYLATKWAFWINGFLPNFTLTLTGKSGTNITPVSSRELIGLWLRMLLGTGLGEELSKVLPVLCVYGFLQKKPLLLFFGIVMTGLGFGTFETLYTATFLPNLPPLIARMCVSIPIHVVFATFNAWILTQGSAKNRPVILSILLVIVTTGFAHGAFDALLLGPLVGRGIVLLAIPIPLYFGFRLLWRQCKLTESDTKLTVEINTPSPGQ